MQETTLKLRSARIAVALHFFLTGAVFATWATRIPAVQARLALNTGQLGLALFSTAVGELLSMNLAGYLAALFGSRLVTTVALVCLCALLPVLVVAPNLAFLMITLLLFGASFGAVNVAMNTQGVAVERGYGRSILSSFHACYSLGGLAGALTSGLAAAHGIGPVVHFSGIALPGVLLTLVAAHFLLPSSADAQGTGVAFARPTRALLALGFVAFCALLGEGAMADWSAVYLSSTLHTDAGLAAAGYAAFSVVMAIGRMLGGRLTDRLGPEMMVRLGGCVAAGGLALALLVPGVPTTLLGFGLVGAGFSIIFPLTLSAAGRSEQRVSGTAIATVAACGYCGFLVGAPAIGFAANSVTLRAALGLVVFLSLCAAACARVVGEKKQIEPVPRNK